MQENDKPVLIYSTFPSAEAAESVGKELVELRLAACVNVIAGMTSIYRWEGKIARDSEAVMIIKTRKGVAEAAMAAVKKRHAYTNPAMLAAARRRRLGRLPCVARARNRRPTGVIGAGGSCGLGAAFEMGSVDAAEAQHQIVVRSAWPFPAAGPLVARAFPVRRRG